MNAIVISGLLFFWFIIMGCITGAIAQRKGREFVPWFLFGGFLFIVALPLVLLSSPQVVGRNAPHRTCPYCGAMMKPSAGKCPKCNRSQPASATSSMDSWEQAIARANDLGK